MSICIYIYSYPKDSVPFDVRDAWNMGHSVSHVQDVFGEVEHDTDVLEWSPRISFCYEALNLLTPKDLLGRYHGDIEFPVTREQLIKFKKDILELDQTDVPLEEWAEKELAGLQAIIDNFNFDEKYITVHTD